MSKNRVAPIRGIMMPLLEMMAALIGSKEMLLDLAESSNGQTHTTTTVHDAAGKMHSPSNFQLSPAARRKDTRNIDF